MGNKVLCSHCQEEITPTTKGSLGYGRDKDNNIVCYSCCAELDRAAMRKDGKITLYLTGVAPKIRTGYVINEAWRITNWPGSLEFRPIGNQVKVSSHNWARDRYDTWFVFEGFYWHGFSIGDNTELLHCKRTKTPVAPPPKKHYVGMAGLRGYMPNYVTVGETRGSVAEDLGQVHELSGRAIKRMRRDNYFELDLYEHGNEYCEIVVCDCGKDISAHDDDPM